jgi:anti-sigma regulatory factor (Ser/Thr protein kinase)
MSSDQAEGLVQVGEATVACEPAAPLAARTALSRWVHKRSHSPTAVSRWLNGRAHAEMREDACLLVSELVTNSIRHADQPPGAPVRIRTFALDGGVRVEVEDRGHGTVSRRANGGNGGFGLHLVELLAARWGVSREHGTLVWFELTAPDPGR